MPLEEDILINKYGQGLIDIERLIARFNLFPLSEKRDFLTNMRWLIMQSKPQVEDIEPAIAESKLKPTYTPCVLLRKGVVDHNLKKIAELPEHELNKVMILLLTLFKIAYNRRFEAEKGDPHKWWYWDLSDDAKVAYILERQGWV